MARADGMTEGVEMAGEIKKQKQKKNKMNVESNDGFGFSEEAFETREENWSVKEPFESPPPPPAQPPSPKFMEEVEAESPEQPESFEFSRDAANRFARAKDGPSTWTPSLGWKGGSKVGPETGKSSWSTQAHQASWTSQSSQSYSSGKSQSYQTYQSYGQNYNSKGYQGTSSNDANATATSGSSAWANWKSNNNSNNEWWERPSRRETSEEFADAVKVTKEGLLVILLRNRGLDEEGIRRFCNWLPGFMRKQRSEETQLVQRGDCFLAKELDASKNYLNAAALKMLLTVLKEQRIVLGVLNLHHNKLDGAAASMLGMWIKTCPLALYELHLSHNEIDTEGALEIIQEVAISDQYPSDRPGSERKRVPLWLRMEHNRLEGSFEWRADEIFSKHRKAEKGPHLCWLSQNQWGQCKSNWCCLSSQHKCPVVHLPYVKQHFLPSQKDSYWSQPSWNSGKAWRPVRSNEEESGWQNWRPKTSDQGTAAAANSEEAISSPPRPAVSEACETPDPTSEPDENTAMNKAQVQEVSVPAEERPWKEVFDEPADLSEVVEEPDANFPESPAKEEEKAESLPGGACEGVPSSSSEVEVLYDYSDFKESCDAGFAPSFLQDEVAEPLPTPTEVSAESPEKEEKADEAQTFSEERPPEGEDREVEGTVVEPESSSSPVKVTPEQEKEEVAGHILPEETPSENPEKSAPSPAPEAEPQEQEEELAGQCLPATSQQEDAERFQDGTSSPTSLEEVSEFF